MSTFPCPATNITYLLVSLFILYVGIILYVDGDYLYNKVKDFTLRRCGLISYRIGKYLLTFLRTGSNVRRNTVKRLQSESGLNYLTDTLTSAWDAMRANFGVSQKSAAPHGWLTRHRWRPNILIFILHSSLLPVYFLSV